MNKFSTVCAIFFNIFIWEHISRISGYTFRPTYIIDMMTTYSIDFFNFLGIKVAILSSFLVWLDLTAMLQTLDILLNSILSFMLSSHAFIEGYAKQAWTYINPGLVHIGLIVLIIIGLFVGKYLYSTRDRMLR